MSGRRSRKVKVTHADGSVEYRSNGSIIRPPRMATAKQMRLWRDLAAELRLPPPPSQATFAQASGNIGRLLRLKHPERYRRG